MTCLFSVDRGCCATLRDVALQRPFIHACDKRLPCEEKEHLEIANTYDTGSDPIHNALKRGIKLISKLAIKASEKI